MKTLAHGATEMALHVLAYNMKRRDEPYRRWRIEGISWVRRLFVRRPKIPART